jgi:hypothetical protein
MKGFPKHINSKKDLYNLKNLYPEQVKKWVQEHQDGREGWYTVRKVESKDAVKTSETVRAREVKTDDITETYEEQYGPIPGNAIDRFGLTDEDIAKLVDG